MMTKDDWIAALKENPIKTLDHTLYNRMYGSTQKIKEWILSDNSAKLLVDQQMPEWFEDFWGMMPPNAPQLAKLARSWSAAMELIQDCGLRHAAEYLRAKKDERLYLYEVSPSRDLLGQYYHLMATHQFSEFSEHWVSLAGSTLDIPLHHREIAMNALLSMRDLDRLDRALAAAEASLTQISEDFSGLKSKGIQVFLTVTCSRFREALGCHKGS